MCWYSNVDRDPSVEANKRRKEDDGNWTMQTPRGKTYSSSSLVGVVAAAPSWNSTVFQDVSSSSGAIVPISVPTFVATATNFACVEEHKIEVKNT